MAAQTPTQMQQSLALALPGFWKLPARSAMTLKPRQAGILQVGHGQIWATSDGPHSGPPNDLGDRIIGTGDQLALAPGERVVVEAWSARSPAYFSWDPAPQSCRAAEPRLAQAIQPWTDLRLALVLGADAAARLVAALGGLAWNLVAARGRASTPRSRCPASA